MSNYRCWYKFYDLEAAWKRTQFAAVESLGEVTDGFWINDLGKFTKGSDAKWWIPPSAILIVEKVHG
jgi:hypothetical protein